MNLFQSLKVRVPKDLSGVTTIDRESEAAPEAAGLTPHAVNEIWQAVEGAYRSRAYPALTFCLRRRGQVVLNRALGHARGNGPLEPPHGEKILVRPETPICLFSASKAVTAVLTHMLAEDGGIDLDKPVAHYIPEFAAAGKAATTIAEVLAHRGGFPTLDIPPSERDPKLLLDWDFVIKTICQSPPMAGRSQRMAYHAITGGFIVAEIIQRVTGKPVQDYLDRRLRQPLGMKHFTYGLPREYRAGAALNYCAGTPVRFPVSTFIEQALMASTEVVTETSNTEVFYDGVIPAGNLYATAEELSRFYQMLLDSGEYGGRQVMKSETVRRAVRPVSGISFDRTLKIPMRYSEGMMLGLNPFGIYGPGTARAYGHLGFMNILGWADPARDISVGLLVTGKAVLGTHLVALFVNLLGTISRQCK
ncbi:MAG: serine hydrolase domain-containing protein [Stenotrophobium sp.]